ncbi:MAG: tRNA (adenosine(37)-N6)-threonylcarbamoyltransferase complex transferase subunit TsaD [Deltaproteobacteria bacterium]|nr:tRNA (adenosine(37)-N6)-threonylcarbamoyltransferase complex transferase subunit TsaD [Candidatus Zymogenaceae bacterium]
MLVLGIDTSCDDTCAAVLKDDFEILSSVVSSQDEVHGRFGGVVPELASRKHVENIIPIIDHALSSARAALSDIDVIAVTRGPGLVGSLVVGVSAAKALSLSRSIPLLGINHIEGHIASSFLTPNRPAYPFVALVVSGGHTNLYIARREGEYMLMGQTLDDAAGEAFDKVAKLLGLGYPGGRAIESAANRVRGEPVEFTRPYMKKGSHDFSFSGIKTAARNVVAAAEALDEALIGRIAAGFQEAVIDVLVSKTLDLARRESIDTIVVTGGVAANTRLRTVMDERASKRGTRVLLPPKHLCTDNAAMIAAVGRIRAHEAALNNLTLNAVSRWTI